MPRRIAARLLSIFSALAIAMAALGVYGTLSHIVAERRKEIGLRLSLGVERRDVLLMILRQRMFAAAGAVARPGVPSRWPSHTRWWRWRRELTSAHE